jgi:hypothetical protein
VDAPIIDNVKSDLGGGGWAWKGVVPP